MQPQSSILLSTIILFSILVTSCSNTQTPPATKIDTLQQPADNAEIKRMAELDQQMRIEDKTGLEEQDSKHRIRILNCWLANWFV